MPYTSTLFTANGVRVRATADDADDLTAFMRSIDHEEATEWSVREDKGVPVVLVYLSLDDTWSVHVGYVSDETYVTLRKLHNNLLNCGTVDNLMDFVYNADGKLRFHEYGLRELTDRTTPRPLSGHLIVSGFAS